MTRTPGPDALEWGIRAGFRDYLDGLGDAVIELDGLERTPTGFRFPAAPDAVGGGFTGRLHVRAHAGALDLTLARPAIITTTEGAVLTADIGARSITLARLLDVDDTERLLRDGGEARDVALSIDGSIWLGGVYGPWARMDPLRVLRAAHPDTPDPISA